MATLEDIAKVLGVSKSTVSKALNGACDVSESMRRAVLDKAVELGYTRLRRGEDTPRLAIFVTNMHYQLPSDFGYDIIVGFRKLAEPDGFWVDIIPLTVEMEKSIRYDTYIMQGNYRGALFLGLSLDHPWLQEFETCKTPTVLYDNRVTGNPRATYLGVDNEEGMHTAVRYLKNLGHTKIGYLGSALGAYVYQQRQQAFLEALRQNELPHSKDHALAATDPEECAAIYLPRLLQMGCTAIVCSHDVLAKETMDHCRELGLRIPEDISILGFDDLPLCEECQPSLSTIRQNRTQLGKSAYCALSSQMEGVPLSTFLLHTELVERASCGRSPQKQEV